MDGLAERRGRPVHLLCRGRRLSSGGSGGGGDGATAAAKASRPNGHAGALLSPEFSVDERGAANSTHYSPVSLELDPAVNNGSGIPDREQSDTKEQAVQIDSQPASSQPGEPRGVCSPKHFPSPYLTKTSMQGDVYNFLERPAGLRCFLYHFLVWVLSPPPPLIM